MRGTVLIQINCMKQTCYKNLNLFSLFVPETRFVKLLLKNCLFVVVLKVFNFFSLIKIVDGRIVYYNNVVRCCCSF